MELLYRGEHFDANFFHAAGIDIDHAFFLSKPRMLFVPRLNYTLAKARFKGKVVEYVNIIDSLRPLVRKKKLLFDARSLPTSVYLKLKRITKLEDASEKLFEVRMVKKPVEFAKMKKAVRITKKILREVELVLKKGKKSQFKTENDVRAYLMKRTFELGVEPSYDPIVASDPNSRFPHYQSGNNARLRNMVLIDFGVRYNHYCADLTRCYFLSKNKEMEANYVLLKRLFAELVAAVPKLKTGKQLALFAKKLYQRNKLPPLPHSLGHGIGLDVHEFPRLSKRFNDKIEKGTTLAIEPSVYFKNYGLRFEETVYFDGKKVRVL